MQTASQQRHVAAAAYLGWTLDAFDFFIMVFVLRNIAETFSTTITAVTVAILLTLAMRALGARIFGRMADRFGRRPTLMLDVLMYSVLGLATAFSPSLTAFAELIRHARERAADQPARASRLAGGRVQP